MNPSSISITLKAFPEDMSLTNFGYCLDLGNWGWDWQKDVRKLMGLNQFSSITNGGTSRVRNIHFTCASITSDAVTWNPSYCASKLILPWTSNNLGLHQELAWSLLISHCLLTVEPISSPHIWLFLPKTLAWWEWRDETLSRP